MQCVFYSMYNLLETEIRRIRPMYLLSERRFFLSILLVFLFLLPYENYIKVRGHPRYLFHFKDAEFEHNIQWNTKIIMSPKTQIKINKFLVKSQRICQAAAASISCWKLQLQYHVDMILALALRNDHLNLFFALAIDEYSKLINLSTECVTINERCNEL